MATPDQVLEIRLLTAETLPDPYTDEVLGARIDAASSLNAVALQIWTEKAARYSKLVSISEGGSSRSNSDLFDNAQKMIALFQARVDAVIVDPEPGRQLHIHKLTR